MRLDRVEVRHVSLPLRQPFETSVSRTTRKDFLVVMVRGEGLTGYGECVADADPFYLPETNGTALHVLRQWLIPIALGLADCAPHAVAQALDRVRGHRMAKAALEMACWDLEAQRRGVPLARVLGGTRTSIDAGVSVGLQPSLAALVERVGEEIAAGYRRIKIKIKPGHDLALVAALRERWPDVPLMVDANCAYAATDIERLRALDGFGLTMIEQPLGWDDMAGHVALQRALSTPICLDECIGSPGDAALALEIGACRIVNLKPGRVGGLAASLALHDVCVARAAPLWCGGMVESGIGRLANVHLQTLPGFTLPGDTSAGSRYFEEDLVDPPVAVAPDGTIAVPTGPGLGHEVVTARLDRATTAREEWLR